MGLAISTAHSTLQLMDTSKSYPSIGGTLSNNRAPTDPIYFADVDIQNCVVGSRWILGYDNNGTFTTLFSGEATTSNFTVANVPSYATSFVLELRVRKASTTPKYKPLKQFALHSPNGITMYISQVLDDVVT